jgi:hypothetical protein
MLQDYLELWVKSELEINVFMYVRLFLGLERSNVIEYCKEMCIPVILEASLLFHPADVPHCLWAVDRITQHINTSEETIRLNRFEAGGDQTGNIF